MKQSHDRVNLVRRSDTESVARACRILAVLERDDQPLRLRDVVERTGLNKATAFRILGTMVSHGLISKSPTAEYRASIRRVAQRNVRIGYAAQTDEFAFSRAVTEGIVAAAAKAGVELVMLNNAYNPVVALQNVAVFIKNEVELVMEFQTDASIASLISTSLNERRVPLIAIEIPHPKAIYFGANNSQAGLIAGRYLGRWAEANWKGRVDQVVLLGLPMAGSLPGSRLTGALLGLREIIPSIDDRQVVTLSGNGQVGGSYGSIKQYLSKNKHEHSCKHYQRSQRFGRARCLQRGRQGKTLRHRWAERQQ